MPAITKKKHFVRKLIKITYNDGTDHTVKVMNELKARKLLQKLIALGGLVTFTAKDLNKRTVLAYA